MYPLGKILVVTGVILTVLGFAMAGKLGPLGKLPGDILISRPGFTFYLPLTTGILLSIILTLLFWFFKK